ncbi:hypothetical protein GOP47_0027836, partial [Adiantum capillus-veneris]
RALSLAREMHEGRGPFCVLLFRACPRPDSRGCGPGLLPSLARGGSLLAVVQGMKSTLIAMEGSVSTACVTTPCCANSPQIASVELAHHCVMQLHVIPKSGYGLQGL